MHRRQFLTTGVAAASATWLTARDRSAPAVEPEKSPAAIAPLDQRICLFTDHLDDSSYSFADVAGMLSPLKIAGPDLTVRGGGLVPPDRATDELPKAVAAFKDHGMSVPMLTTSLTNAGQPDAGPLIAAMGKLGIRYYKLGYYHYHELAKWEAELGKRREELAGLMELGRKAGVIAGFHNHAGGIGGAVWDAWQLLEPLDPAGIGFYFDPAHASIEGAKQTWRLNLHRIAPRLVMVALKDYVWEKGASGWQTRWCPLGEGMVNWTEFFQTLIKIPFAGPLSLHIEYDPGGSTRTQRIERALAAAQRDVDFVRKHLAETGGQK